MLILSVNQNSNKIPPFICGLKFCNVNFTVEKNYKMKHLFFSFLVLVTLQSCNSNKSKFVFNKALWAADWSPDGKFIAVGGNIDALKILSSEDLSTHKTIKKLNTITKIKWHPDGQLLAISKQGNDESGSDPSKVEIIDVSNNTTIQLDDNSARGLGWNSTGTMLAVGSTEGVLSVYSNAGHLIKKIQTDQKAIVGLSWHPSQAIITTVGSHIEIIDLASEDRKKITPREIEILMLSVEWHPSGAFFVTGDYGDNILNYPALLMFWDSEGNKIREIEGSRAEYRNLKWNKNGDILATASDMVRTWTSDGVLIDERNLGSFLWGIDWSTDGSKIVTTSGDGKVFKLNGELKTLQSIK